MKHNRKSYAISRNRDAFTFVELIITTVLLGIVMIPLGLMSLEYTRAIVYSRHLVTVEGLAKTEMAKINNLSYTDATLIDTYDNTTSNYEGYPYDFRRTVNYVAGWNNNLKQVQVRVYPSGNTTNSFVNLITYIADVSFGAGSQGIGPPPGDADSLVVTGGGISGDTLGYVTLQNTSSSPITITGVTISFTGRGGINLSTITMDEIQRWSGSASSGSTITLTISFTLTANTTYNNTGFFVFNKILSSVTSLVFIMSDGSQTVSYAW